ncbi:MAG: DUF3795 domain-containing protein [Deltaproteobacteria bacterium]|nr:DUF3795 domain-containing protein [Deltaproteobacteria bacterium]
MARTNRNLTACCGLYCADCIPSDEELFHLVQALEQKLADIRFDLYSEYKTPQIPEFKGYPAFLSVLRRIGKLHCPTCRQGGGNPQCTIRACVREKGLNGCWECGQRPGCGLLDRLRKVHRNLDHHLDLIAEMGPEAWFERRKGHYRWQ